MNPEHILAVLLTFPQYAGDIYTDGHADRAKLLRPVALAIAAEAKTSTEAAALIALGYHETAFARYVLDGHCEQGPIGARCDGGRARGPWQVWSWCRGAWAHPAGPAGARASLRAEARCAVGLLRAARTRCAAEGWPGVFAGYRRLASCRWSGATRRVATLHVAESRLRSIP